MGPSLDTTPLPKTALSTACFLACAAYTDITGKPLVVEHSIGSHGKFCWTGDDSDPIPEEIVTQVRDKVMEWLEDLDGPRIQCSSIPRDDALRATSCVTVEGSPGSKPFDQSDAEEPDVFYGLLMPPLCQKPEDCADRHSLLKVWRQDPIPIIKFGDKWDLRFGHMETVKRKIIKSQFVPYEGGIVVRAGPDGVDLGPMEKHPKLFNVIKEYERWGSILKVSTVSDINRKVYEGKIRELCWVSEALHEKKLAKIAESIAGGKSRVVCISGPSSSGKTTFAKKLHVHLQVCGKTSLQISADDYFLDHKDMREDIDFEHVDAVNAELMQERVLALLRGETVKKRSFSFHTGTGSDLNEDVKLPEGGIIIIEGIHMLNPLLWEKLKEGPEEIRPVLVYVTAVTQLNLTSGAPCSTADTRLLRRIVRDHQFRGYSAEDTLRRWPSVRRGEKEWIFPHQERADHIFNSALAYELNMLAVLARGLLCEVHGSDVNVRKEAHRLITMLGFLYPVAPEWCPGTSLLREFLGKSDFYEGYEK